ncbi:hypothetical protein ACIQKE_17135 [Streptomyces griseoviridis]|uniref:Uncharacterized protein n=1 Tax=Streptomyces griseoviridis TaxID=45398 RepID=A0A3Q9KVM1_STRGD|nr:hypothetical protein [Streptomyces griseoviridis]AZS85521.1 hypothetical protein ELQ87_15330 [Streptomyces griseoviridis]QCN87632.1 hypothetical protein DDJ31_23965 [Streptomyces griseoviridis]
MAQDEPKVTIGNVDRSTFAIGAHARAESSARYGTEPGRDQETEELLRLVRELRAALPALRVTDETAALGEALADTEAEIDRTGQAGPTRRERLRALLADSQGVVSLLTSAAALATLLGG